MYDALLFILGFAVLFGAAYWFFEVYTPRKHWREACEEVEAMRRYWERADRPPPRPVPPPSRIIRERDFQ